MVQLGKQSELVGSVEASQSATVGDEEDVLQGMKRSTRDTGITKSGKELEKIGHGGLCPGIYSSNRSG